MKGFICCILFTCCLGTLRANNPYMDYLIARMISFRANNQILNPRASILASIPKYQIPKGAIFCRMEDKVSRATKIWLKVGVQ